MRRVRLKSLILLVVPAVIVFSLMVFAPECLAAGEAAAAKAATKVAPKAWPVLKFVLSYVFGLGGVVGFISVVIFAQGRTEEIQQLCALPAAGCGVYQAYCWLGWPWTVIPGTKVLNWEVTPDRVEWSTGKILGYLVIAGICAVAFLAIVDALKKSASGKPAS